MKQIAANDDFGLLTALEQLENRSNIYTHSSSSTSSAQKTQPKKKKKTQHQQQEPLTPQPAQSKKKNKPSPKVPKNGQKVPLAVSGFKTTTQLSKDKKSIRR
jgi:hypothetical protein